MDDAIIGVVAAEEVLERKWMESSAAQSYAQIGKEMNMAAQVAEERRLCFRNEVVERCRIVKQWCETFVWALLLHDEAVQRSHFVEDEHHQRCSLRLCCEQTAEFVQSYASCGSEERARRLAVLISEESSRRQLTCAVLALREECTRRAHVADRSFGVEVLRCAFDVALAESAKRADVAIQWEASMGFLVEAHRAVRGQYANFVKESQVMHNREAAQRTELEKREYAGYQQLLLLELLERHVVDAVAVCYQELALRSRLKGLYVTSTRLLTSAESESLQRVMVEQEQLRERSRLHSALVGLMHFEELCVDELQWRQRYAAAEADAFGSIKKMEFFSAEVLIRTTMSATSLKSLRCVYKQAALAKSLVELENVEEPTLRENIEALAVFLLHSSILSSSIAALISHEVLRSQECSQRRRIVASAADAFDELEASYWSGTFRVTNEAFRKLSKSQLERLKSDTRLVEHEREPLRRRQLRMAEVTEWGSMRCLALDGVESMARRSLCAQEISCRHAMVSDRAQLLRSLFLEFTALGRGQESVSRLQLFEQFSRGGIEICEAFFWTRLRTAVFWSCAMSEVIEFRLNCAASERFDRLVLLQAYESCLLRFSERVQRSSIHLLRTESAEHTSRQLIRQRQADVLRDVFLCFRVGTQEIFQRTGLQELQFTCWNQLSIDMLVDHQRRARLHIVGEELSSALLLVEFKQRVLLTCEVSTAMCVSLELFEMVRRFGVLELYYAASKDIDARLQCFRTWLCVRRKVLHEERAARCLVVAELLMTHQRSARHSICGTQALAWEALEAQLASGFGAWRFEVDERVARCCLMSSENEERHGIALLKELKRLVCFRKARRHAEDAKAKPIPSSSQSETVDQRAPLAPLSEQQQEGTPDKVSAVHEFTPCAGEDAPPNSLTSIAAELPFSPVKPSAAKPLVHSPKASLPTTSPRRVPENARQPVFATKIPW